MKFSENSTKKDHLLKQNWLIAGLFAVLIVLEFSTPPEYIFGYFYTGPILLANSRSSPQATLRLALVASGLTLLNLVFPGGVTINPATVANRLIVVLALIVTSLLSQRNQEYEKKLANQQVRLQSQEKLASMRSDFVSTLTHDLKTPLLGGIETLKSFQVGHFGNVTSAQQKVLEMMERSHRTTLQLVETLLDVYRNDIEGLKLKQELVNLASLAEQVIATLTDLAATRRVYIYLSYGESDFRRALWVKGDELQLQRVFINLLTNGINHSPRSGKVEVVLESHSAYHVVKVLDTGQGIGLKELPHLFERFYQGHGDRQAQGSGLGLYLSRQIIEAHGGTIWAENRSPLGALFGFRLLASPPPDLIG